MRGGEEIPKLVIGKRAVTTTVVANAFATFGPVPTIAAVTQPILTKTLTSTALSAPPTLLPTSTLRVSTTTLPTTTSIPRSATSQSSASTSTSSEVCPSETPTTTTYTTNAQQPATVLNQQTGSSYSSAAVRDGIIAAGAVLFVILALAGFLLTRRRGLVRKMTKDPFRSEKESLASRGATLGRAPPVRQSSADSFLDYMDDETLTKKVSLTRVLEDARRDSLPSGPSTPRDTLAGFVDEYSHIYDRFVDEYSHIYDLSASGAMPKGVQRDSLGTIVRRADTKKSDMSEAWRISGLSFSGLSSMATPPPVAATRSSSYDSNASDSLPRFSPSDLQPMSTTPFFSTALPALPAAEPSSPVSLIEEDDFAYAIVHGWVPQRSDEVLLEIGDRVTIYQIFEDGWCEGVNERTALSGMFPLACLKDPRASARLSAAAKPGAIFHTQSGQFDFDFNNVAPQRVSSRADVKQGLLRT
ncbi:JNK-interacting protein 1 [Thoreauomyces humboldtii]|nr:JNK-interacting protein 1 [Thoreauomyces humboldtii]